MGLVLSMPHLLGISHNAAGKHKQYKLVRRARVAMNIRVLLTKCVLPASVHVHLENFAPRRVRYAAHGIAKTSHLCEANSATVMM